MVEVSVSVSPYNAEAGPSRLPRQNLKRKNTKRKGFRWVLLAAASALSGASAATSASTIPLPRWGQASALYGDYFVIHGGKTNGDAGGGYTFTSGINTGELLLLDLTQSFTCSSPPWSSINASTSSISSPSVAFHSLLPVQDGSQMMVFGGDVSQTASSLTSNDSAYMLGMTDYQSAIWSVVDASWGQPERRIFQSADTDGKGSVWIVGGERDDGSYIEMDELWMLNSSASLPSFTQQSQPISGLVGSTATLLSDGSLLVLGGQNSTGLQTFTSISSYSTTDKRWRTSSTKGVNSTNQGFPAPRLGHVAVSLPNKKVFIHGGATADWQEAMSDAWILDWSQSPPTWSEVSTVSGSAVPSARFGHSAVARGDMVVLAFGWAGNNAADADIYIFDTSSLTSSSSGVWTGGAWTSVYTPDSSVSSSKSGSNGSSTSSGGKSGSKSGSSNSGSSSSNPGSQSSSSSSLSGTSSAVDTPKTSSNENDDSSSTGQKAGAALGALVGLGLIAGAGYLVYRKRQPNEDEEADDYGYGDGSGLLRGSNYYYGADDDPQMVEKGRQYTGVGVGGIASFQQGTKPLGPRTGPKTEMVSSSWSMANIGHAMEGSGPHLRERLALITGFGLGAAAPTGRQQRFDMLADEDEDRQEGRHRQHVTGLEAEEDDDDDDRYNGVARRVRERSYGQVDQFDDDEDVEQSCGDLAGIGAHYREGNYIISPFEDTVVGGGETGLLAGNLCSRDGDDEEDFDEGDSIVRTIDTSNTSPSRNDTNSSTSAQHSHSSASITPGIVSFSDSSRRKSKSGHPSPLVRRSPTWWDRFMGQSFLERSASGRLLPGPRAEEPIRDPTQPPVLSAIRESGRSADPSEDNPFADNRYGADEMGRCLDSYPDWHNRSMSSVQSGNTVTSSIMEARLQNMDVVQREGTASSRRTYSSGRSGSSEGVSRGTSMRSSAGHHLITPSTDSTPGSIVFDPSEWNAPGQLPDTVEEGEEEEHADISMDIVDLDRTVVLPSVGGRKRSNTGEVSRFPSVIHDPNMKRTKTTSTAQGRAAKIREASDAPSLTPSTTKRARQNRQLTSPVRPAVSRRVAPPIRGSVLDRVKAIEKKRVDEGEAHLPIPRSPAHSDLDPYSALSTSPLPDKTHMFVPGRGGRPILTKIATTSAEQEQEVESKVFDSPLNITSPVSATKVRYSHGLVPKPQLFVANPDGRVGSADS